MRLEIASLSRFPESNGQEDKASVNVVDAKVVCRHSPVSRAPTDNMSRASEVPRDLVSAGSTKSYVNVEGAFGLRS